MKKIIIQLDTDDSNKIDEFIKVWKKTKIIFIPKDVIEVGRLDEETGEYEKLL